MKILHIQLLPLLSGVQRVSLNEMTVMKSNFDYSLICASRGPLTQKLDENGIKSYLIPELSREINFSKDIKAFSKMFRLIKKEQFDVVHTHSSKTGVLGRVASKLAGVKKVVHTVHGFSFPAAQSKPSYLLYFFLEWFAKFFTDVLIVLNQTDADIAIKKLGYDKKKVFIVPNGVDIAQFRPVTKSFDNEKLNIIMVGRLWRQKDPETLLRAAISVLKNNYNISLTFVGDGELKNNMQAASIDYRDSIKFNGWCDNISELLSESDLFVLPSLWEGMPLAILEALSCGVACVVSDIPGNNDLISNGFNGYLFPAGDDSKLANIIINYINNPSKLREHSINSRQFIESDYSLNVRNEKIKNIYLN